MSIHDVSKHDDRRLKPLPNTGDVKDQRDAHGTISANYTTDATDLTKQPGIHGGFLELVQAIDTAAFASITVANPGAGLWSTNSITAPPIAHGLNYTPTLFAYLTNASNQIPTPYTIFNTGVGVATMSFRYYFATVDNTNVYLTTVLTVFGTGDTAPALPCKYYLMRQPPI